MRRLSAVPYARRYLGGQAFSILGDTSMWLAMAIWVRELTGSNAQAGLSFFFMAAPSMAAPLWGTVVDRFRRRPVLILVNALAGVGTLSLLAVQDKHQVWLIWLVLAGYGVSNGLLSAAQSGFLHTLVPDELLGDAQGTLATVREGLRLVSPLLGAGLFSLAGGHVVAMLDAGTFAVAALSLASIRVSEPAPERYVRRLRTEVAAGWQHVRTVVPLRQVVVALAAVSCVIGFAETAVIAVVTSGLHLAPSWIGPFESVMGVGAIAGGLTVAPAMRRLGEGRVSALGMAVFAVGGGVMVFPWRPAAVAGFALAGVGLPWLIAAAMTLIQRLTPSGLQGRVSATVDLVTGTPQSLSIAVGAGLLAVVGFRPLLLVMSVVMLATGGWLFTRREQRALPAPVADQDTPAVAADTAERTDALVL